MSKVNNSLKITDIVVLSHIKKKIKKYYLDRDVAKISISMFPQYLVISLVTLLEDLLTDSLKYVTKNDVNGLYIIDMLVMGNVLSTTSKYDFFNKYIKQYSDIQYEDSLFFNLTKVLGKLESKHGDKLMINSETKRYISFLLLSLQYDICNLAQKFLKASNRVTMSKDILLITNEYIIGDEINKKIKLKIDCISEMDNKTESDNKDSDTKGESDNEESDNDESDESDESDEECEN